MLFRALNISSVDRKAVQNLANASGITAARLKLLDKQGLEPMPDEIKALARATGLTELAFRLRTGFIDRPLREALALHAESVGIALSTADANFSAPPSPPVKFEPVYSSKFGELYRGDCVEIMRSLPSESIDLIFCDPPFNLDKLYPSEMDDDLRQEQYLEWCENWLNQCVRLLKDGGALFLYNLPKWNTFLGAYLNRHLTFRHWITVDIKFSMPISGRLYPSHYSLLYYIKGERPAVFVPDRLPMEICPNCLTDLKDYGGYKDKMNPLGVNLTDVWNDIPPVRHAKYKKRKTANELSIKLLDRIIELGSKEGDLILDPFGGSGTTYAVAEMKNRKWVGMEIGPIDGIIDRIQHLDDERPYLEKIRNGYNHLFLPEQERLRQIKGLWTAKSFQRDQTSSQSNLGLEPEDHRTVPMSTVVKS
jgi:site-specific DNA-methyltransferase (adenine-specific)